jgi:hypothetical protein
MQKMLDTINTAEIARTKAKTDAELDRQKVLANIEAERQKAYAESVKDIMASIEPGLIEALNAHANADMMTGLGQSIAPYAMANGESVADAINKIVRGTTMESVLKTFSNNNK